MWVHPNFPARAPWRCQRWPTAVRTAPPLGPRTSPRPTAALGHFGWDPPPSPRAAGGLFAPFLVVFVTLIENKLKHKTYCADSVLCCICALLVEYFVYLTMHFAHNICRFHFHCMKTLEFHWTLLLSTQKVARFLCCTLR